MIDGISSCEPHLSEGLRITTHHGSLDDQLRVSLQHSGGPASGVGTSGRPTSMVEAVRWRAQNVLRHRPKLEEVGDE
jgi:hypothetical protein